MNLDGGTSAIMWYDGEYITKCSNQNLPEGRPLPTAFVYERAE
jgi:exopolysaccharide biosynthesis protein